MLMRGIALDVMWGAAVRDLLRAAAAECDGVLEGGRRPLCCG
jgi:hypothetical protein